MDALTAIVIMVLSTNPLTEGSNASEKDIQCMVANIWHESVGEDYGGWIRVAQTVRNRIRDYQGRWSDKPCEVIWERGQFEWTSKKKYMQNTIPVKTKADLERVEMMINISLSALAGEYDGIINGAVEYYAFKKVKPCWHSNYESFIEHGNHRWGVNELGRHDCWLIANKK